VSAGKDASHAIAPEHDRTAHAILAGNCLPFHLADSDGGGFAAIGYRNGTDDS
jgi:hypothetical protein